MYSNTVKTFYVYSNNVFQLSDSRVPARHIFYCDQDQKLNSEVNKYFL